MGRLMRELVVLLAVASVFTVTTLSAMPDTPPKSQYITVYVLPGGNGMGFVGPREKHHDTIAPSNFVLHKGVPVTLTIINYDDMHHSIVAPGLGVAVVIKPSTDTRGGIVKPATTTYTFTPNKVGTYRWNCTYPCDMPHHWAMSHDYDGAGQDGFMAGYIEVL